MEGEPHGVVAGQGLVQMRGTQGQQAEGGREGSVLVAVCAWEPEQTAVHTRPQECTHLLRCLRKALKEATPASVSLLTNRGGG